jgi:hypothetical protein
MNNISDLTNKSCGSFTAFPSQVTFMDENGKRHFMFSKVKVAYAMSMQAHMEDACIDPNHSRPGTRRRWMVGAALQPLYP